MNFFYTIISVFLTNYFIGFLVDILPFFGRKKMWKIILVSIYDALTLAFNAYVYIGMLVIGSENFEPLSIIIELVFNIIGTVTGYVIFLMLFHDDSNRIFKSRREKNFLKASKGKETKILTRKNVIILNFCLSLVFLAMLIITLLMPRTNQFMFNVITYGILAFLSLALVIVTASTKMVSHNALLIIRTRNEDYVYQKALKSGERMNKYLDKISEYYIVNDYGYIYLDKEKYQAFGFDIKEILEDALNSIDFERFDDGKIKKAYDYLDTHKKKAIYLDINGEFILEKIIK